MNAVTIIDLIRPVKKIDAVIFDIISILCGSIILALSAQIAVPVPFSPVPITGQTFGVMLVAVLLGSRRGSLAVLTYLAEGITGLPVFAYGAAGAAQIFGPTGGYLIGFIPAAFLMGLLAEQGWDKNIIKISIAFLIGNVVIFIFGLIWLGIYSGYQNVLMIGLYPFIPGTIVKILLIIPLLPVSWKLVNTKQKEN